MNMSALRACRSATRGSYAGLDHVHIIHFTATGMSTSPDTADIKRNSSDVPQMLTLPSSVHDQMPASR
jgi:hypothetical protein